MSLNAHVRYSLAREETQLSLIAGVFDPNSMQKYYE